MKQTLLQHEEIGLICQELALLIHAGVGAADGLSLMAEEAQGTPLCGLLAELSRAVDEGQSLAQAVTACGRFPAYVCSLLAVGQRTGHLEEALEALASYYEQRQRMEAHLRDVLLYPALLFAVMLVVIVLLLTRVLPLFQKVYQGLGGQLSGLAAGLYRAGQVLCGLMPLLVVLLAAFLTFLLAFGASAAFRQWILAFWQRKRGDQGAALALNQARFAQGLAMGLRSGMPEEEALELARDLLGESPGVQTRCEACRQQLAQGNSLARALESCGLLPRRECSLLELSLRSGAGDRAMAHIAQRLAEQSEQLLNRRAGRVEPAMVLVTSLLVGGILLSVMLPLMDILWAIG